MDGSAALDLLRSTRRLTVTTVLLLSLQLFGNLYEEVVTNVQAIADPGAGTPIGEIDPGSPLFFYLPWVPIGLVTAVILSVRLHRLAPSWVARRAIWAMAALAVAVTAKAVLISQLNPLLRLTSLPADELRGFAIAWAMGNGVAIVAVAAALVLLVSWRARVLDSVRAIGIVQEAPEPAR